MNYSDLQAKIAAWLHRNDLNAVIPDFIALAEERINRDLRVRQMEVELAATAIVDNRIAVPAGIVGVKALWLPNYQETPLKSQSFESALALGSSGTPTVWAWQGEDFYFNGAGDVQGVLYESVPALSGSDTTNWLLDASFSVYLFGGLMEAAIYIKDEASEAKYGQRFTATIDTLNGNDKRDTLGGPLVARPR